MSLLSITKKTVQDLGRVLLIRSNGSFEQQLRRRRKLMRRNPDIVVIGKLYTISFEQRGMSLPRQERPPLYRNLLQWGDDSNLESDNWPLLAVSKGRDDLLIMTSVPHPPDLPDTNHWAPTDHPGWASRGAQRPVMYPQRYRDRTTTFFKDFLVIQPVDHILYKPMGDPTFAVLRCHTGFDGTKMAFLIDPNTGEGHFIGGRFLFDLTVKMAS
jgi:hypothetical protein